MLAPFLIMLREGIEAALITGIIATYLRQTGRGQWLPAVWVGILLAIALSLFTGAALQLVSAEFPQKAQEFFEAGVGVIAVIVLMSMVFWMRKASRSIKQGLHDNIDHALSDHHGAGAVVALVGMVFFAVAREGLESIFFLLAIFQQSLGPAAPLGALLGIVVSAFIGIGIYGFGVRINLKRFFQWTGVFIIVVAGGLLASALRNLHEAGVWNILQDTVYDMSQTLPASGFVGTILSGVFNYQENPNVGQVALYAIFLIVSLYLFLRPMQPVAGDAIKPANHTQETSNARI